MLVLACAVFLLAVAPAVLLWLGRMIEANTDGRRRVKEGRGRSVPAQAHDGFGDTPWFRRLMRPAFGKPRRAA